MFNSSHERCHRAVRGIRKLLKLSNSVCDRCERVRDSRRVVESTRIADSVVDRGVAQATVYEQAARRRLSPQPGTNRAFFQYATLGPIERKEIWADYLKASELVQGNATTLDAINMQKAATEVLRRAIEAESDLPDAS